MLESSETSQTQLGRAMSWIRNGFLERKLGEQGHACLPSVILGLHNLSIPFLLSWWTIMSKQRRLGHE